MLRVLQLVKLKQNFIETKKRKKSFQIPPNKFMNKLLIVTSRSVNRIFMPIVFEIRDAPACGYNHTQTKPPRIEIGGASIFIVSINVQGSEGKYISNICIVGSVQLFWLAIL